MGKVIFWWSMGAFGALLDVFFCFAKSEYRLFFFVFLPLICDAGRLDLKLAIAFRAATFTAKNLGFLK